MRIIITLFILILTLATAFAEQSYQVKFYRKNGLEPLKYSIYDINKIDIKNVSNKYIIKIHHQDTNTAYYPVVSIDSIKFETDTNQIKYFTPYLFGTKFPYSIAEIDSVIFEEIETIINEDAIVVDTNQLKKILYLDSTLMIVDKSAKFTNGLAAGDIIVGEPSDNTPDGFLRKVISIKTVGDSIEIEAEQAALTDVIQSGVITFSKELIQKDSAQKRQGGDDETLSNDGYTVGFTGLEIYEKIQIDGSFTYYPPTLNYILIVEDFDVKQLLVQYNIQNTLNLKAYSKLEYEKTFQKSLNELLGLDPFEFAPILIPVGTCPACIPVVLFPNIDLQVGITLTIGAEVNSEFIMQASVIAGIEYNSGVWSNISELTSAYDLSPPKLSVGGSLKGFLGPQLNVNFYNKPDALNVYVGIFGFGILEVDLLNKPLWQFSYGAEAKAGIKSKWFDVLNKDIPIILEYKELIAKSNDLISYVSPLIEAQIGDTITITGEGFGITRGTSTVIFKYGESLLPEDLIVATQYPSWSDNEIKVVAPYGLPGGDVKLLLDVGGYLSNQWNYKINKVYEEVTIGSQTWMLKNLDVSYYKNGDSIRYAPSIADWLDANSKQQGAWCYYNNDPANDSIYGKLYNWYAVNDPRGLAPNGYHVPSYEELLVFYNHLHSNSQYWCLSYRELSKSIASKEWWLPAYTICAVGNNLNANNISGFTGQPAGARDFDGSFFSINRNAFWWTTSLHSDEEGVARAWFIDTYDWMFRYNAGGYFGDGYSVRCLKD